jgi:hypothetical protein
MADRPAILNEALDTVQVYPARGSDVRAIYPDLQPGSHVTDDSFAEYPRVVLVREDPDPELSYGQRLEAPQPDHVEKREDGHWHLKKVVIDPDSGEMEALRQSLLDSANGIAAEKRKELTAVQLLTFRELERLAEDATPTAAEYPLIRAYALGRSDAGQVTTFQEAQTAATNFRDNWMTRSANIERKYREIVTRINQADTLGEAKAILDELEALE